MLAVDDLLFRLALPVVGTGRAAAAAQHCLDLGLVAGRSRPARRLLAEGRDTGPGCGQPKDKHPITDWPQRCAAWMQSIGLLEAK